LNHYGFSANPKKTPTTNFNTALNTISRASNTITQDIPHNNYQKLTLLQPKNLSFHNLCTDARQQLPPDTKNLLGLGLKFCIASSKTTPNIKQCLQKLAYKIRTKQYRLQNNNKNATPYIPQIYVKLKGWHPPPAPIDIENKLTTFEKLLKQTIHEKQKRTPNFTNLTITQRRTLEALKNNKEFIILPTDKNLGPAIMNRDNYIKQCLTEHLLTHNYKKLPNIIAMNMITSTKNTLNNIFNTHKHQLSQAEITYFTRSFKLHHRTPIFYGMCLKYIKTLWPFVQS
jgi:hypothetical protein